MSEVPEEVIRDEEYYFSSADLLIFQVENRLFKVHRFFLERESPIFRDMLSLGPQAQASGDDRKDIGKHEGGSDARPIHIPDVTVAEFRALLEMLYKPFCIYPGLSQEQWLALVSVADRFQVPIDHAHVMKMLETMTPRFGDAAQVKLAENCGLAISFIKPALTRLVTRHEPLKMEEMDGISLQTIILLSNAREKYHSHGRGWNRLHASVSSLLDDAFGLQTQTDDNIM